MRWSRAIPAAILLAAGASARADDWTQFQQNAASHGRAPGKAVEPPFALRWVWWGPDNVTFVGGRRVPKGEVPRPPKDSIGRLSFTMHAVVAGGRVVFGDLEGVLYCLDAADGSEIWKARVPGAFVHAPAIHLKNGRQTVVAPCQDGRIHAFDEKGRRLWSVKAGRPFVTPAKLDGDHLYAGSLDGRMYAVDVPSGKTAWTFDAGAPIRQPAAVADGRVFFGSEDMTFHALDAATGRELWKTEPGRMKGQSFRNTWPVVVGDKVMTFQILVEGHAEFVMEALLYHATPGGLREKRLEDWPKEREAILRWLEGDLAFAYDVEKGWQKNPGRKRSGVNPALTGGPFRKTLFVFDVEGDGKGNAVEPYQVPMGIVGGTGNSNMGPTLDAAGRPVLWWRVSASSIITGGGFGTAFSPDLSAMNLKNGDRMIYPTTRDIHKGGPGMELDNHHMLTSAGDLIYYFNPFRQARWVWLDGKRNPSGNVSTVYRRHDGGGWDGDVVYFPDRKAAGRRGIDTHGSPRTPVVIAGDALFVNELDVRALACYQTEIGGGR